MSRFSPTILPSGESQLGDAIVRGLQAFRSARRETADDAWTREEQAHQRAAWRDSAEDRGRGQAIENAGLFERGIVQDPAAPRSEATGLSRLREVIAPGATRQSFGEVSPGPEAPSWAPALESAHAEGGSRYVPLGSGMYLDTSRTPEAKAEDRVRRLRDLLTGDGVDAQRAEVMARTGKVDTYFDPPEWKPRTRAEASGFFLDTEGRMRREGMANDVRLEGMRSGAALTLERTRSAGDESLERLRSQLRQQDTTHELSERARLGTPGTQRSPAAGDLQLRERRSGIVRKLGTPTTPFQQRMVDQLSAGKTAGEILSDMQRAGLTGTQLDEARRYMGNL